MRNLVLITDTYPYRGVTEASFVEPEIGSLSRCFDRVILVPSICEGTPVALPENVEVDLSLAAPMTVASKLSAVLKGSFVSHLAADVSCGEMNGVRDLWQACAYGAYSVTSCRRLCKMIERLRLNLNDTLFYTFWFDFRTAGVAMIDGARFVTRAHRHDLYQHCLRFISPSWRRMVMSRAVACYPVSEDGADYMRKRIAGYADKISTRYLGSARPQQSDAVGQSDVINLLTVCRLDVEKRVPLTAEMLMRWAIENPSRRIMWRVVGDGSQARLVEEIAARMPANVNVVLMGSVSNREVHRLMARERFEALLLLSTTEGLPVAVMEALSYGIPVLATDVGGVREAVDASVGALLPVDFSYEDFARGLEHALAGGESMRTICRSRWAERFDAVSLREDFARELRNI